jgi:hypothetical protein
MNLFITLLENVNKSRTSANNVSLTPADSLKMTQGSSICFTMGGSDTRQSIIDALFLSWSLITPN